MAIDMKKMRAKLAAAQNRGSGRTSQFWRPQDGDQTVRIVPTADGDPFKENWFHYNLGKNAGFLSPKKNFGEDDPLDSFVRQLFNEGTDESIKMAKNLMARQRFFAPVIVRGEETKGVRIWGFGKTVYEQLLNLVLNPEYGDITDPETGTLRLFALTFRQSSVQNFWRVFQISTPSLSARRLKMFSGCWTNTSLMMSRQRSCPVKLLSMVVRNRALRLTA